MKDGVELPKQELDYDQWLEFFRKQPAGRLSEFERLKNEIPTEGYAALKRWQEIIENPSKMDKLYQGRLKAENDKNIMDVQSTGSGQADTKYQHFPERIARNSEPEAKKRHSFGKSA